MTTRSTSRASETFSAFHKRPKPVPVHPFHDASDPTVQIQLSIPHFVCVGRALRVLYESDKWSAVGDVTGYFHDHGPDDGEHVFSEKNKVKIFVPVEYAKQFGFAARSTRHSPVEWSDELVLLGSCGGWVAQDDGGELLEAEVTGAVLCCSPFGHVDSKDESRCYLIVLEPDTGLVEAVICGPGLRVTPAGITG